MGIYQGEFLVSSEAHCFTLVYSWWRRQTLSVSHFSIHGKDTLPRVCPCMTGLWLKTVLYGTTETRTEHILGLFVQVSVCNNSLKARKDTEGLGPGQVPGVFFLACPCQALCMGQHTYSLPPADLGPNVSISVRPTSSFILYMSHSPYTTINFVHNTDHLLTYYVKDCAVYFLHSPPPPHTHYNVICTRQELPSEVP